MIEREQVGSEIAIAIDCESNAQPGDVTVPLQVNIAAELYPYFDSFRLDVGQFNSWITRRLGEDRDKELGSLAVNFLAHPGPYAFLADRSGGSFSCHTDPPSIKLNVFNFLEDFHEETEEFDHEVREMVFNDCLNRVMAHEVEHWVDFIKGGESLEDCRGRAFVDEIMNIREVVDAHGGADNLSEEKVAELTQNFADLCSWLHSFESQAEYKAQPHEVRAREAAKRFAGWEVPIFEIQLRRDEESAG